MRLYEIRIEPVSFLGTPLKGDTIFGQFCWQAKYDAELLNGGLEKWIACYDEKPFAIFSTAWPIIKGKNAYSYALKRPDYPLKIFSKAEFADKGEFYERRKERFEKTWMLVGRDFKVDLSLNNLRTDAEIMSEVRSLDRVMKKHQYRKVKSDFVQAHNTINRTTMTTGEGLFAPYSKRNYVYSPGIELAIFVLLDLEATDIERVAKAFQRIGKLGFGRDASTGLGRFIVSGTDEITIPKKNGADACYTLSPAVPERDLYEGIFFSPFTRFGRHGDILATSPHPFKAPIIMADEGAVFFPKDDRAWQKPYLGRAITGISKVEENTVAQGYSIYLPIRLE